MVYDHHGRIWYVAFLLACVLGVFVDPLFLYVPIINQDTKCVRLDGKLLFVTSMLRFFSDSVYLVVFVLEVAKRERLSTDMAMERVNVRWGTLNTYIRRFIFIMNPVAKTIWCSRTLIDILAVLPIPQVIIGYSLFGKARRKIWIFLNFLILFQYIPRVFRISQLLLELPSTTPDARRQITPIKSISKLVKGFYMFFLLILGSHVFGALWYFYSYQGGIACWQHVCSQSKSSGCERSTFQCGAGTFKNVTILHNLCPISPANASVFDFGIFLEVLQSGMLSSTDFSQKFWRCFWWGLRNLSSFGQNIQTRSYAWENIFAVSISLSGMFLVLIYLSAILQLYVESATTSSKQDKKLRKLIAKRNPEIAAWLDENELPSDLKEKIMASILSNLAPDREINILNTHPILRLEHVREITLSLCLPTLKRMIPTFQNFEQKRLEQVCVHLRPVIYAESSYIIREHDPLDMVLIITQGTANAYRVHPHENNSSLLSVEQKFLQKGDFYGEELLDWVFKCDDTQTRGDLPTSPETVKCSTKVEGFYIGVQALLSIKESAQLEP